MKNNQMKLLVVQGILFVALVCMSTSSARAADWCDDFEGYPPGSSVGTNWVLSGNISSVADATVAYTGAQSLKMFGLVGGCFGAVAHKPLETGYPMTITLAVRNGDEFLSGCHPARASMGLRFGNVWQDPTSIGLFYFLPNGDLVINSTVPNDTISGFNLLQWYDFKINVSLNSDSSIVNIDYWSNGSLLGQYSADVALLPNLLNASNLDISAQEGTIWYDDVCVSSTPILSKLTFPSVAVRPCDNCTYNDSSIVIDTGWVIQPVVCDLSKPASGASIPVRFQTGVGVEVCDIDFQGLITENWEIKPYTILNDSGYLHVALANFQGLTIPTGPTTLFNILYRAPRECLVSNYIHWDTALYDDVGRQLKFSDTATPNQSFGVTFDLFADSTEIMGYKPGDINNDTIVDIADLTMLIDHLFINFPELCVYAAGNINGDPDGDVDIADLTALIDHLFINFPPLFCPGTAPILAKQTNSLSMESVYENGRTTIRVQSDIDLRGVELTLTGDGTTTPHNLLAGSLDIMSGMREGELRIGLADLDGGNTISAGTTNLVELEGNWQIERAVVSDLSHQSIDALSGVVASGGLLPVEFSLDQNYPNPFNPSTEISFTLPVASSARLDILNMLGQTVITLVNQQLEAGEHTVTWNAGNIASGVYFYKLTAGEFVETRKMLLLK